MNNGHSTFYGLEIGSSKITLIGAQTTDEGIDITGAASLPSDGVRRGTVINMSRASAVLREVVSEFIKQTDSRIPGVALGISGQHIRGVESNIVLPVYSTGSGVTEEQLEAILEAARDLALPEGTSTVHVLPQEYEVNGIKGIKDPIGMEASRLGARVNILTAGDAAISNLVSCAGKAGLKVDNFVARSLASAEVLLSQDEKDLGVAVLDIGGGCTEIACYDGGIVTGVSSVGWGGEIVTSDIAVGLKSPLSKSEEIKIEHGTADDLNASGTFPIPGVGGRPAVEGSKQTLARIISSRLQEVFELAQAELDNMSVLRRLGAGIVLTGGTALIPGIAELAERVFGMPVRVGVPIRARGLSEISSNPSFSCAIGIAVYEEYGEKKKQRETPGRLRASVGRVAKWFESFR
jgi:cell division protein FtsA